MCQIETETMGRWLATIILGGILLLACQPAAGAATIFAKETATGADNCTTWDDACTLQTALATAVSGDEIWVKQGTHTPGATREATFQLVSGVGVYGGFAGTETSRDDRDPNGNVTILSGDINGDDSQSPITDLDTVTGNNNNSFHVVTASEAAAILDGFTITGGYADSSADNPYSDGAGIYCLKSNLTLTSLTITGNLVDTGDGGGMFIKNGSPTLTEVILSANLAKNGGGIHAQINSGGTITVERSAFIGNTANSKGGGIYDYQAPMNITNSTFSGNSSTGNGGAIAIMKEDVTLDYCTVSENTQSGDNSGSGLYVFKGGGILTVSNSIVSGNAGEENCAVASGGKAIASGGHNIENGNTCGFSKSSDQPNTDPLLDSLSSELVYPLQSTSPAIDNAGASDYPATDQRGVTRPQDNGCDIGAYESGQADQTITFDPLADKTYGDADFTLSASASSGLTVEFASTTTAVCTVSETAVSLVGTGTCSITASQPGDADYNAATDVVQSFTVKADQTITFDPLADKTYGDADFTLSASASSGLTVEFASTTTAVCTVSGTSVSLVGTGTCSITASQPGDADYNAATDVVQNFTVGMADQAITFDPLADMTYGEADFTLSASASSGLTVEFASFTTAVCTVSGTAVSLVGTGTCSITASQPGDANYNAATDVVQSFTVGMADQAITFDPLADMTYRDADFTLGASASSGLTVEFASTTTAVCTVSGTAVSLVGTGTCSITASQPGDDNYNAATDVVQSFTVYPLADMPNGGGGGGGTPAIGGDGAVITSGAYSNTQDASDVEVGADATVNNNGTLTDVSNEGTISGGEISGDSANSGTLSRVTVTEGSTVNNSGGTISYGTNNGEIYGGTFEGGVENNGLIYGGAPEGYEGDGDFTVTIEKGAVVTGGAVGGDVVCNGELNGITLVDDSVIVFSGSGSLTGTITIAGDSGAGTITIPSGVSFPPEGSGIVALTPQTLVAFAMANGWFSSGSFSAQQNLPALDGDLLVIAGMILTQEGIKLSEDMTVTLAYDPDAIPQGFTLEDLALLVYDPESGLWISADFEEIETGVIQFTTQTASAYALVLPTEGTGSPILDIQSSFAPADNLIVLTGSDLADVTAAPTLLVSDDWLEEEVFVFMGMSFENGMIWVYDNPSGDFENPDPAWRVYEAGTAISPFGKKPPDDPEITFDAGLANLNLTGKSFSVVIYIGIAEDENMTGFSGAAYELTFEGRCP